MFGSMGLAICALCYLVLILLMYLYKKRLGDTQNKIFTALLILTIALTFSEIAYVYGLSIIDTKPKLTEFLCRLYTLGNLLWINLLMFYLMTLLGKNDDKEKERKHNLVTALLLIVLVAVITAVSFTLPLDYSSSKSGLYNFGGPATAVVYIDGILLFIAMCLALVIKNKSVPKEQKKPIYFSFVTFVTFITLQLVFEYDYNTVTFIFAFMIATLYFTIESQDSRLVQELEVSKEAAAMADKAKTEFLLNMSHEIRTPMSTILGFSEILLNEEPLLEDVAKRDTESINQASTMLMDLIHAILDISALETNKETILNENYYTKNLVFDLENEILDMIGNKIEYKTTVSNNLPKELNGDVKKIHKILINIVNYFIKATNRGKITLDIDYKKIVNKDYELTFNIISNNCDIKQEKFDIEFNDFVKLGENNDNSINNDELKLIIAKRYIALLNGKVVFNNDKNVCECNISIVQNAVTNSKYNDELDDNIHQKDEKNIEKELNDELDEENNNEIETNTTNDEDLVEERSKTKEQIDQNNSNAKNILIFDNNKINHKIITRLLNEYNFNISSAYTKDEFESKIKLKKYDLFFIDSEYFDDSFDELVKEYSISSIMIEMSEEKIKKPKEYINDIIYKPISKEAIDNLVENYLNGKGVM